MERLARCFLLGIVVAGCQPQAEALDPQIDTLKDVPSTTLSAADVNDVPSLAATLEVSIAGEATNALLTRVESLLVNDSAEVTLPDPLTHVVRTFKKDGQLRRQFGGRGDGPGEFRRPYLIASFKDTVYVVDENGISLFLEDGRYLNRVSIGLISNRQGKSYAQHFPRSMALADGRAVISEVPVSMAQQDTPYQQITNLRFVDLQTGALGEPFQRIPSPMFYPVVFAARWKARFGPDQSFVVRPDASVIVAGIDGRTINVFEKGEMARRLILDVPRREVTKKDLAALTDARVRKMKSFMEISKDFRAYPADYLKTSREGTERLPYFKYQPAVGRILGSDDGRIFVNRPDLSVGGLGWDGLPGMTVWNVFGSDLRAVGKVELPAGFTPIAFHGDLVAGTSVDSLDVPSVGVYRIAKSAQSVTRN